MGSAWRALKKQSFEKALHTPAKTFEQGIIIFLPVFLFLLASAPIFIGCTADFL
jgi:hypothetical protein